jgi:hypothetical protein
MCIVYEYDYRTKLGQDLVMTTFRWVVNYVPDELLFRISSDFRKSSFLSFKKCGCHIYTAIFNSFDDFDDNDS